MASEVGAAKEMYESGDRWMDRVAELALPVLIWCARHGKRITYGQLARELERRDGEPVKTRWTLYGMPAGKIGEIMQELSDEWGEIVPPINAILVNASTGLPGSGADSFLADFLNATARRRSSQQVRKADAEYVIDRVFRYRRWGDVAQYLGIHDHRPVQVFGEEAYKPVILPDPHPVRSGGESEQHKRLKEYVAGHPALFGAYGRFGTGRTEAALQSGDEVDVLFTSGDAILAVEVKAANAPDSELWRGVFQCVKYEAVLRAMQFAAGEHPTAVAVLVVERRLPEEIERAAARLGVERMGVKPE